LGLEFIPMEQIVKDAVESLKNKGFISWMMLLLCGTLVTRVLWV
jgi:hypothetical protein